VVSSAGLNATFLPTERTLPALKTADDAILSKESEVSISAELQHWGVMFDVFANRSINITSFDINSFSPGVVSVWVYARKCAEGVLECGLEGVEESIDEWVLLGYAALTVRACCYTPESGIHTPKRVATAPQREWPSLPNT